MNKIVYPLVALLAVSLVFVASNSFAKNIQRATALNRWDSFMVSTMIGKQLKDQKGNRVGEIKDFVIDQASGRVSHVILSQVRGMEAKPICVPFSTISETPGGEILVYHPPEVAQKYYGQAPYWSEGFYLYADQPMPMGSYEANKLIGATVRASNGEFSQVKDLEIYAMDGSVYAVFPFNVDGKKETVCVPLSGMPKSSANTSVLNFVE